MPPSSLALPSDEVVVTPNFEFVPSQIAVAELNGMIAAKLAGFPIAWSSIYDFARRGGLTEFDVEQELAKIQEEGGYGSAASGEHVSFTPDPSAPDIAA